MNTRNNAWSAVIEVVRTFRHDPPFVKLAALLILGIVVLGAMWMLLQTVHDLH